jgi:hypothetical protein
MRMNEKCIKKTEFGSDFIWPIYGYKRTVSRIAANENVGEMLSTNEV